MCVVVRLVTCVRGGGSQVAGAIEDVKPAKEIVDDMIKVAVQVCLDCVGIVVVARTKSLQVIRANATMIRSKL